MAKKIYSFIESQGHGFRPPPMEGPDAIAPVYLGMIDGRHYVAVEGDVPEQPREIRALGPLDMTRDAALRDRLRADAMPYQAIRRRRAQDYPDLGEQLGVILAEFAARQAAGEAVTPAMEALLGRLQQVVDDHPLPDLGLD